MEIDTVSIEIKKIKNGVIGNVNVICEDSDVAITPVTFYPTLSRALEELCAIASDPETILSELPPLADIG